MQEIERNEIIRQIEVYQEAIFAQNHLGVSVFLDISEEIAFGEMLENLKKLNVDK